MLPDELVDEKLAAAIAKYASIPRDVLATMKTTGMPSLKWDIDEEEPELPVDLAKLPTEEVRLYYSKFVRWFGLLKTRLLGVRLEYVAAKKIRDHLEAYLRLLTRDSDDYTGYTVKERELAILTHPQFVEHERNVAYWEAVADALTERISIITQARERAFREARSRESLGGPISREDYLE